ncbi:hypothetical protein [Streptomyces sp. NPDC048603]|uniref:hypothetical protein n=1 Tax=Streptomyces sp. NPDC048603 TaxID=3365577 RepID=UPI003717C116
MLALRLTRGSGPLLQLRRLLVAAASAGTGYLLLCILADAAAANGPAEAAGSFPRLLWALVPLAVTVQLAVAVARTDPATRPPDALTAVGLGPVRTALISAVSTAVACTLGSAVALAVFLHLRGDLTGLPFDGAGSATLHAGLPLPVAGALTLLALTPLAASAAVALVLRPHTARTPRTPQAGLPWGVALTACGLAAEAYAGRGTPGALAGWSLTAVGLALAGPGLTHACGTAVQAARPGALRLLAGRALQEEAGRVGGPLGVTCAVAAGGLSALALSGTGGTLVPLGPLTGPAAALVAGCAAASLITAGVEVRQARAQARQTLLDLGTPVRMLRTAATLRAAALLALCLPLSWAVAQLTAVALSR